MTAALEMRVSPRKQAEAGQPNIELEERIRSRAYQLYEQRGRGDGHDLEDWFEAEAELTVKSVAA